MSNLREIINFWSIECMKLTSEATVCVRFTSGVSRVYEFAEPDDAQQMMLSFTNWCELANDSGYGIQRSELK